MQVEIFISFSPMTPEYPKLRMPVQLKSLYGITDSMDISLSELRELVLDREAWRAAIHVVTKIRHD